VYFHPCSKDIFDISRVCEPSGELLSNQQHFVHPHNQARSYIGTRGELLPHMDALSPPVPNVPLAIFSTH